ncbi:hypothetical protein Cgig2_014356 [Carnegiea gigantea]|uniref:Uncharacterized protein n=1 Tax=Carnegiea gigantea TaxID=171969 RepID=A0A9Q1KFL3_9CARY|nr:hypothetical protein Cgig2_014356 [Carnegiea gigantea]
MLPRRGDTVTILSIKFSCNPELKVTWRWLDKLEHLSAKIKGKEYKSKVPVRRSNAGWPIVNTIEVSICKDPIHVERRPREFKTLPRVGFKRIHFTYEISFPISFISNSPISFSNNLKVIRLWIKSHTKKPTKTFYDSDIVWFMKSRMRNNFKFSSSRIPQS